MILQEIKNINTSKKQIKSFAFTIAIILLLIAVFLLYSNKGYYQIFFIISSSFIISGIIYPNLLMPIYLLWMVFAVLLGWIMTRVILTLLYYTILTPIGLISRFFGKQFLELQWIREDRSYWKYRSKNLIEKESYKKQF